VNVQFRPLEADPGKSALGRYRTWMRKRGAEETEISVVGWINADLAYRGIEAAGPDFTRASVIAATNEMTDYTADGLTQPVDWSRQHEAATEDDPETHGPAQDCTNLVKVEDGRFEVVGSERTPWLCWPGTTRAWSEPEEETFGP